MTTTRSSIPSTTEPGKMKAGYSEGGIAKVAQNAPSIDHSFIKKLEGYETEGYVPDAEDSESGVTIASGFDLGQRSEKDLKQLGLPENLREKLTPYLGTTGPEAERLVKNKPLKIKKEEANLLNEVAKRSITNRLMQKYQEDFGEPFTNLPPEAQTVLGSVAYQYGVGDLENGGVRSHNFWDQMGTKDFEKAYQNLKNYGDNYPTRRGKEAKKLKNLINNSRGGV